MFRRKMDAMENPMLDFSGLTRFDLVQAEHITPAIKQLLDRCNAVVSELEKPMAEVTWDNFVTPLDDCTEQLSRAWTNKGMSYSMAISLCFGMSKYSF